MQNKDNLQQSSDLNPISVDILNAINSSMNVAVNGLEKRLMDKITGKILESENRITNRVTNQIVGRIMKEIDELTEIISNSFTRIEKRLSKLEADVTDLKISVRNIEEVLYDDDSGVKNRLKKTESTSNKHSVYFEGIKKTLQIA